MSTPEHDYWLEAHDAEVARKAAEKAFDEGQKSGMRFADRAAKAEQIGRPDLPGPLSPNPYRAEQIGKVERPESDWLSELFHGTRAALDALTIWKAV